MLLVCSDFIKIVLDCLYLRGNDSLYSAYYKVHFQYQIKVVPETLNSVNFVSNHYEKFTDRFAGMTWNCHIGYMIFYAYLGKKLLFCSVPWNLWNFMKSGGVFKRPFWRKNFSKSKPIFSTTQNGLAHAQRWWW